MSDPQTWDRRRRCLICKKRPQTRNLVIECSQHGCQHWICEACYPSATSLVEMGLDMCPRDKVIALRLQGL